LFWIFTGVLMLLLLAVPVRIGGQGSISDEGSTFTGWIRFLGWILGVDVVYYETLSWRLKVGPVCILTRVIGGQKAEADDSDEPSGDGKREKKPGKKPEQGLLDRVKAGLSLFERYRDPVFRLLRNVLRSLWFRRFRVDGTLGMGAADATGRMMGYVYAAEGVLRRRVELDIQPDFLERVFKGKVHFEIWFWLGFLILAVLYAALTIGIRYAVWYLQEKPARPRRSKPQTA
jgi:hypothetical protein